MIGLRFDQYSMLLRTFSIHPLCADVYINTRKLTFLHHILFDKRGAWTCLRNAFLCKQRNMKRRFEKVEETDK